MPFDSNQILNQISSFLSTPTAQTVIFILKIVFIAVSAAMLGFIIWAFIKTTYLKRLFLWDLQEFATFHPYGAKKLYGPWQKIKLRLETGLESEYKLAVIEADSMLDDILKGPGIVGETFAERLNSVTEDVLPNLKDVMRAHELRNNVVYNPDFKVALADARSAIDIYETALTDLQAL